MIDLANIDPGWTLFLDRDGVINEEKENSYIFHYGEFVFYKGVLEALRVFAAKFGRIFIVTNQRGIGKELMTREDLENIHRRMIKDIMQAGGRVDAIYYADALSDEDPRRKPSPAMALEAKEAFPEIDFRRALMVGNNLSDMEFGRNAGMHTVFIRTTDPHQPLPHALIDLSFKSLYDFAKALQHL